MLELDGVVKHHHAAGERIPAIDGVSLALEAGEMLALQGPSGSGKTTLLLLIAALMRPDSGTIRYLGREVSRFSEREACEYLLADIGFIYQHDHLMPRVSALENAAIKLLLSGTGVRKARERTAPWLARVGLSDRLAHTPNELSGGERQRVAIARALAREPKLILADEPTGNLDSARSREIVALLSSIAHERGAGVLLVTHDTETAAMADRHCTLRDGRVEESTPWRPEGAEQGTLRVPAVPG